jgi:hypothetical protein
MAVASVLSLVEFLVLRWGSSYVLGALSSALNDSVSKTVNHASIMLVLVQPTSASRVFVFWGLGNPHQARSYRQGPCAVGNTYCTSLRRADSHLLRTGVESSIDQGGIGFTRYCSCRPVSLAGDNTT